MAYTSPTTAVVHDSNKCHGNTIPNAELVNFARQLSLRACIRAKLNALDAIKITKADTGVRTNSLSGVDANSQEMRSRISGISLCQQ